MKWNYIKGLKRLDVFGTDCDRDIITIKKLIEEKKIPKDLETIIYRESHESKFSVIFRGSVLAALLAPEESEDFPRILKPRIKTILKQINESNALQAIYAGVVFYSTTSKRFMFVTPRGKHQPSILLGDNPSRDDETPVEIVCRVALEDTHFEVEPKWMIPLSNVVVGETTYHSFLVLVEKEFKPNLSTRLLNTVWAHAEAFKELRLHDSVKEVFATDPILGKLTNPETIDLEAVVEDILQEHRKNRGDQ